MKKTRRQFMAGVAKTAGVAGMVAAASSSAEACLEGQWKVRCPYDGTIDTVEGVTCDHKCSRCYRDVFTGGHDAVTVMCPKGHPNVVMITGTREQKDKWVKSFKCPQDGLQCRLDTPAKKA